MSLKRVKAVCRRSARARAPRERHTRGSVARSYAVWLYCAALLGSAAQVGRARAEGDVEADTHPATAIQSAREGLFLPNTVAPASAARGAAVAFGMAGYDSAHRSGVMGMIGDIKVYGPLDLRLGLGYAPNVEPGASRAEPQFGLRLRLTSQAEDGIDAAAAVLYRLDRFTADEGMVQAMFAAARRFGRVGLFANLGYGQDPEGDDREGEAALAALYSVSSPLQLGLETHARFDLFSTDARRAVRKDAAAELTSGPVLHYALGPCMLLAQVGFSSVVGQHSVRPGAVALAGVGAGY